MRRIVWILLGLLPILLIPTRAWEASVSQNIAIALTPATERAAFDPTSLTFPSQNVGTSSAAQTITTTNTGTVPLQTASVGIIGTDAGDFTETNDCPSLLPVSAACNISVAFAPTATATRTGALAIWRTGGGTYTVPLSGTGVPPLAPAFYVATNGNDNNPGTLTAPFATLTKCQSAMEKSTAVKTCYIRAGTYALTNVSHNCGVYLLGTTDSGETWAGYPPDGPGTAILDGGANGVHCAFEIDGWTGNFEGGITITALQMQNFVSQGVYVVNGSNITISNNIIHDIVETSTAQKPTFLAGIQLECVFAQADWGGFKISHNYVYNIGQMGVRVDNSNLRPLCSYGYQTSIDHNYFRNVCNSNGDCAAIYMEENQPPAKIPLLVQYNYARDIDPAHVVDPATGTVYYVSMIYEDGGNSNIVATGNIMVSDYVNMCWAPGGSANSIFTGNICDFVTNKNGNSVGLDVYSSGIPTGGMTGNQATGNIMIMNTAPGNTGAGWRAAGPPQAPMYVTNNAYFNYGAAGSVNYHCNGTNACGANGTLATQDALPTYENPQISCWSPVIAASSPAFSAPVSFPALPADWGTPGFWGPPGFTIPQIGTAPSWPHAC